MDNEPDSFLGSPAYYSGFHRVQELHQRVHLLMFYADELQLCEGFLASVKWRPGQTFLAGGVKKDTKQLVWHVELKSFLCTVNKLIKVPHIISFRSCYIPTSCISHFLNQTWTVSTHIPHILIVYPFIDCNLGWKQKLQHYRCQPSDISLWCIMLVLQNTPNWSWSSCRTTKCRLSLRGKPLNSMGAGIW